LEKGRGKRSFQLTPFSPKRRRGEGGKAATFVYISSLLRTDRQGVQGIFARLNNHVKFKGESYYPGTLRYLEKAKKAKKDSFGQRILFERLRREVINNWAESKAPGELKKDRDKEKREEDRTTPTEP